MKDKSFKTFLEAEKVFTYFIAWLKRSINSAFSFSFALQPVKFSIKPNEPSALCKVWRKKELKRNVLRDIEFK